MENQKLVRIDVSIWNKLDKIKRLKNFKNLNGVVIELLKRKVRK